MKSKNGVLPANLNISLKYYLRQIIASWVDLPWSLQTCTSHPIGRTSSLSARLPVRAMRLTQMGPHMPFPIVKSFQNRFFSVFEIFCGFELIPQENFTLMYTLISYITCLLYYVFYPHRKNFTKIFKYQLASFSYRTYLSSFNKFSLQDLTNLTPNQSSMTF